jgi:probable phosphoglycerate mutase
LAETDTGRWTGRSFAEVEAAEPDAFAAYRAADPAFRFPGGESYAEQTERVLAALEDVVRGPLPALIVSHRGAIRLVLVHWRGDESLRAGDVPTGALVPLVA